MAGGMSFADDLRGPERTAQMTRMRRRLEALPVRYSDDVTEAHWACSDCGAPCYCIDPIVRRMPHLPCKVPAA